jgi:hypothetical protein
MARNQSYAVVSAVEFGLLLRLCLCMLVFSLLTVPVFGQETGNRVDSPKEQRLSVEDGRKLVQQVLQEWGSTKLPGFGIEDSQNSYFSEFYFFEALWDNPNGSPLISHFAVDSRTADVWDAVLCRRYHTRALNKLQRLMRQRIGLSGAS